MFTKMFGPPPLANDYSYADRMTLRRSCRERRVCLEGQDYSRLVPREMPRAFWNFIMHGGSVGCEITERRTLVRCERTFGKRGGADKRGGAHSRYQFFRCGKRGGADKRWGAL